MRSTRAPFPSPNTAATSAFVAADTGSTSSTSAGESCSSLDSKPGRAGPSSNSAYRTSPALASTAASPMRVDVAPSNDSATQSKTPVVRQSPSAALAPATAFAPPPGSTATPASSVLLVYRPTSFRSNRPLLPLVSPFLSTYSPAAFSAAVSVWRITPTLWPASTRRRTYTCRRGTGTEAVR